MDYEQIHQLAHNDPRAAWPHIVALIDRRAPWDVTTSELLSDIAFSDALPELVDDWEAALHRSPRFQKALLWAQYDLGGKGGPEMDRIHRLVELAEQRHAVIIDVEPGTRPPRLSVRQWFAVNFGGKIIGHRVPERPRSRKPRAG